MEAAAILRSFYGPQSSPEMPFVAPVARAALKTVSFSRISFGSQGLISVSQKGSLLPYVKASEAIAPPSTSDDAADTSDKTSKGPLENKNAQKSKFPNGFEALILEVCDETSVAELKMKVGDFEMHLKRDIESSKAPTIVPPIVSPTTAPPIPSKPMVDSSPSAQPAVTQKPSPATNSPFANVSTSKSSKLAALDASGANGYVIVSSPTVGSFRSGRTLKGKKQPPSCKEGDVIKEGQIIGFLDQFGNELPVRSDVAGEVLKVLYKDGEAVGYGDPLVAVLPSFHGIK